MRTIDVRTDDELVEAAAGGSRTAFEELYKRHCDAAWGVAMSVTRDRNDAADAVSDAFTRLFTAVENGRLHGVPFRPYLLTVTRNASIDILRRSSRVDPTEDIDDGHLPRTREAMTPSDAVMLGADVAFVSRAFADLPERWRSVLWLTEVEGMAPREAAEILGLSANGAAQLAVRARAGLRERYLQAHLGAAPDDACRFAIEHLGAYVGGAISTRDLAKVDQHLAGCESCRARKEELEEVGSTLRRVIIPIPLFLGAAVLGRIRLASATGPAAGAAHASGKGATTAWNGATKALAGACAGLLTLGLLGAGLRGANDHVKTRTPTDLAAPPEVEGFSITRAPEAAAFVVAPTPPIPSIDDLARADVTLADAQPVTGPDAGNLPGPQIGDPQTVEPTPTPGAEPPAPAQPTPSPTPIAQVDTNIGGAGGLSAALGVGDGSCTGVSIGGTGTECAAPDPTSPEQLSADVQVQGAPPIHLGF